MRIRNKLNVKQLGTLRQPAVYSDGGGLYLRVRRSGSRSWLFIYTLHGRRREMGLGSDLNVSLAQAREAAEAARLLTKQGLDPQLERKKSSTKIEGSITFGDFSASWLESVEHGFRNEKHRQQWRNTLGTYAIDLFPLAIDAITSDDIVKVLQPIWLSKAETASRLRGRIERILDAAKVSGFRKGDNPARGRGHLELLLPRKHRNKPTHHAALKFSDIAVFVSELKTRPGVAAKALEFLIYTAARSGEVRGMTWEEVDFKNRIWTVPAGRMKTAVIHEVPLSNAAVMLLQGVCSSEKLSAGLVFPGSKGKALSDMALSAVLRRMKRTDITVHGFRSTFRDWAGEITNFGREEVEMALSHVVKSMTERAYRRGRALQKRKELMDHWAGFCASPVNGRETDSGFDR